MLRAFSSHTSWLAPLLAVVILLVTHGGVASPDDFGGFVRAGVLLVALCALGLVAGILGILFNLRPLRAALAIPLVGTAANAFLLWYFAPPFLGLAF